MDVGLPLMAETVSPHSHKQGLNCMICSTIHCSSLRGSSSSGSAAGICLWQPPPVLCRAGKTAKGSKGSGQRRVQEEVKGVQSH